MPYRNIRSLPESVRDALPSEAQRQFLRVFNAQEQRGLSEERCFQSAWAVIRQNYRKTEAGKWVKKSDEPHIALDDFYIVEKNDKQRYTLGIVYEPLEIDSQGDYADAETIEYAAWGFMRKLQAAVADTKYAAAFLSAMQKALAGKEARIDITDWPAPVEKGRLGDMHSEWPEGLGEVVESYIAPTDFELGGETIKKGTWLMGVVWSEAMFAKIESGERTGYSFGGRAIRLEDDDA